MMKDVEKVHAILELIDEKSKQVANGEPIPVSVLRLGRQKVSSYDVQDILAMLQHQSGLQCIQVTKYPDRDLSLIHI